MGKLSMFTPREERGYILLRVLKPTNLPRLVITRSRYCATKKNGLRLDEHILPGRKNGPVRDHKIFNDPRIRDGYEKLVPEVE